jgi:uncharacterized protein (TIGR03437 family)
MNRPRPLMVTALATLAVLGCAVTASAQGPQLTVSPAGITNASTPLVFNNIPSGGISAPSPVTVGLIGLTTSSVTIQVNQNSPWLIVSPGASVNIPSTLNVQCNTVNLTSGNYLGSFTITVTGSQTDFVTVYVSLNVTGITQLYSVPQSLSFTAQAGASAATPSAAQVEILSSGVPLNYTLSSQTLNGGNWLSLSANQGSTGGSAFFVTVNPAGLSALNYPAIFDGTITATSTTTADAVQISVQLTLNSTASISVTPTTPPTFLYQAGTVTAPAVENLAISSAGGALGFTVQISPAVSWLALSANSGVAGGTPVTIGLTATPYQQGLQPGTYTTNVVVTPSGEAALAPIPITLVVAAHPLIVVPVNNLSFTASFAGGSPTPQSMTLTGSGSANVGFTATPNVSWIIVNATSSTTPATLTVQVNPTGLAPQNYTGTITIAPTNGDPYTETIAVSLAVSGASQLVAAPQNLLFSYEPGQAAPQAQVVQISTTGQPLTFTASTTVAGCAANWLSAQNNSPFVNGSSNVTVTVSVVPTGIPSGSCSGTISLVYDNGLGTQTLPIGVTLAVSNTAELAVNLPAGFGVATASQVSAPFQQQMILTSTNPSQSVSYTASVNNVSGGGNWLGLVGPTSGTTPQYVNIQYYPEAVTTAGNYTGTVTINSPSLASPFTVPVTLTVTSTTSVSVAPASLSFTEVQGGTPPPSQTLALTSTPGNASYSAVVATSQGGNWLQISPSSGPTNASIQVSIGSSASTLSPGTYQGQISLTFQGAATLSATVNVTLTVTAAQTVYSSPASLSFGYQVGGTPPPSQQITINSSGGSAAIGVAASSTGGWLSVDTRSGTTPQTINVSVNPSSLITGTYSGSISITAPGVLTTPLSIPVTLTITSPPAPQPILIINNASGAFGVIAPGEEIAIKGNNLGPSSPAAGVLFSVNSSGGVSSTLAGVQVLFNSVPGTPIYVSASQIDVVVPYEINGQQNVTMTVLYNNVASAPFQLGVVSAAPGLFTLDSTGQGQVAAINQNNSVNGTVSGTVPAPRGTVVSLYGTGGGQTTPISTTGSVTPVPASAAGLLNIPNVTATVGGAPATVLFAGAAPGIVTGILQVNIVIPTGIAPGNAVPVAISIGNVSSPVGTTLAVQ